MDVVRRLLRLPNGLLPVAPVNARRGLAVARGDGWIVRQIAERGDASARWRSPLQAVALLATELPVAADPSRWRWVADPCDVTEPASLSYGQPNWRVGGALATDGAQARMRPHATMPDEGYLRLTLEHATIGIAHTSLDGRCLLVNAWLRDMLDYSHEEALSRHFQGLAMRSAPGAGLTYDRRLLDLDPVYARRVLRGELPSYTVEKQYHQRERAPISVGVTVSLIRAPDGRPDRFMWVVEDITARKQAEAVRRDIQDGERRRIARGLHDVVMQDLVYALQCAQVTQLGTTDRALQAALQEQIDLLQQAVRGLRGVIYDAHHQGHGDRALVDVLETLVRSARQVSSRHDIALVVQDTPLPPLPTTSAVELAHIVREALTNARRHAGARSIAVSVGADEGAVWVEVADDGRGFDAELAVGGVGLDAMRERARAIGAALTVVSEPGHGTHVRVRAPVRSHRVLRGTSLRAPVTCQA